MFRVSECIHFEKTSKNAQENARKFDRILIRWANCSCFSVPQIEPTVTLSEKLDEIVKKQKLQQKAKAKALKSAETIFKCEICATEFEKEGEHRFDKTINFSRTGQ